MKIQLSDHFTFRRLLRFTLPSIAMMIFSSVYIIIDGFFVSNYVGATAFAAVNLIMPVLMILSSMGFMIGTGGSALVSMTLGQGKSKKANEIFSLLIYFVIACGAVLDIIGYIFIADIASALGATPEMLPICVQYARISLISLIPFMLQNVFQSFLVTAEKPHLGLVITVISGVANIFLDWLLVGQLSFGVSGAATATVISEFLGGVLPLIYFITKNKSLLRIGKTRFDGKTILRSCLNGSSELMTYIAASVVDMLYNMQLLKYIGEPGVAAYGVIMYYFTVAAGLFMGYSLGAAPVISYNYGSENTAELKGLFKKSLILTGIFSVFVTIASELGSGFISSIFVGYDAELMNLTVNAFRIYSVAFLFMGFNMFASSFFTALNNGPVSALISFARTLVFEVLSILILPGFLGVNGIWGSVIVAEAAALVLSIICLIIFRKKYRY